MIFRHLQRHFTAHFAIGLSLTIIGARWTVIERYGSDLPYWDQWGSEGEMVLTPWFQRGELWANLFAQHSEHRIVPTKALNLGLVLLGGQWDARIQCAFNACLLAALASGLFVWTNRAFGHGWSVAAGALLALLFGLPLALENILGGFQSQFYFLAGFSLLAMHGLLTSRAFSPRWFGGVVAGLPALVSMGSGFFFSLPVAAIAGLRLLRRPDKSDSGITLATVLLLLGIGCLIRPHAPWQDVMHAHGVREFSILLAKCLAWPKPDWPWFLLVCWLPWFGFLGAWFGRGSPARNDPCDFVVAGGLWVLLQVTAASYARGAITGPPPTRYYDVFSLGLLFSFLSFAAMACSVRKYPAGFLGVAWGVIIAIAALFAARASSWHDLSEKKLQYRAYEQNVQAYLLTDDFAHLDKAPVREIPLFSGDVLARILGPSELRRVLPVSVRAPVPIDAAPQKSIFIENGYSPATPALLHRRVWGSRRKDVEDAGTEWRSYTLPRSNFRYWKFEIAGSLGQPGLSLQLTSALTGEVLGNVAPSWLPGDSWRSVYVRAPDEPTILVARDSTAASWFAFSEPVEMSGLSYWTWQLLKQGQWIFALGLTMMLGCIAVLQSISVGALGNADGLLRGDRRNCLSPCLGKA